ncbi:hypothetical protein J4416_01800 [Candidatus Pacearchaeota archaeon]|nr:hypothetical protein [Candidatus Pacearchaeota archaeon]
MPIKYPVKYAKELISILILVVAVLALYYTFVPVSCEDYSCFEAHMTKCRSAVFVNEEDEASWKYEVLGTSDKKCNIEVTLLNAKEGNIDLRRYEDTTMTCAIAIGVAGYPEKNLELCHGTLKEGLQSVVIEKLYKYIIANLGEIREELIS